MNTPQKTWIKHLREEIDAAYLYEVLSGLSTDPKEKDRFGRLQAIESRHVAAWMELLHSEKTTAIPRRPTLKARLMARVAKAWGAGWLRAVMLREEGHEVKSYLGLYRESTHQPTRDLALDLARDSAGHARELGDLMGRETEPWHRMGSGGLLRNIVYGFNDGLTANFGLIAGVVGAKADPHFILVSGLAGLIADALSMGASGYLAAKSEQEVYIHEKKMEAEEIRLMPELEAEELAIIYEAKGMQAETARDLANSVLEDPQKALEEKVREELGITSAALSPWREAWLTGLATAIGALIPVLPFFFWSGTTAIGLAFGLAMGVHFIVGAARSFFTGRNLWRSGLEMLIVGMGVAVIGYLIGEAITRWM